MVSSSLQGNIVSENARKPICVTQSVTSYAPQSTGVYATPICEVLFPAKKTIQGEMCDYFPSKAQILGTGGCKLSDKRQACAGHRTLGEVLDLLVLEEL